MAPQLTATPAATKNTQLLTKAPNSPHSTPRRATPQPLPVPPYLGAAIKPNDFIHQTAGGPSSGGLGLVRARPNHSWREP